MLKKLFFIAFIASPLICSAQTEQKIHLKLSKPKHFDVLYHRASSTATGAVLGGLIGAAIEEGIRSSDDREKREALLPYVRNPSCEDSFLAALTTKLTKQNYLLVQPQADKKRTNKDGFVLDIKIDSCGYKLINSHDKKVSAFISFKATMTGNGKKDSQMKEQFLITSKNKYSFNDLLKSTTTIELDFTRALERAGKRLANRIIYRK